MKIQIGIVGTGGIATDRHIPTFMQLHQKCDVSAVYDVDVEKAARVGEAVGANVYSSYEDMLEHVDAVCICTPNAFHADLAIAALDAGVHVFCEKPMAISSTDAARMNGAAKRSGCVLAIGFHYRFMHNVQVAKKQMASIGDPLVVRVRAMRRRKVPGWGVFTNKSLQGGGSLIDYGCHLLDTALWLIGNLKAVEVTGATYNRLSKNPHLVNDWGVVDYATFEVDDHATAYIRFEGGASLLLECSWAANIKEDTEEISISGSDGGISVFPLELYQDAAEQGEALSNDSYEIAQAQNFIGACLGQETLVVQPEEAMQVTEVIERIYESAEQG